MKRIHTIILLSLLCVLATAQIAPNPRIPNDPVDYSRLKLPTDEPALRAFFTMEFNTEDTHTQLMAQMGEEDVSKMTSTDKITVLGTLVHTWNITPEYVEECIEDALKYSGIGTRERLAQIYRDTPIFKDFTYTNQQFVGDMFGFVTGLVGLAVPAMTDVAPIVSMTYGATTGATGLLINNLGVDQKDQDLVGNALGAAGIGSSAFSGAMPGAITSTIGNGLTAAQMLHVMRQQYGRDVQKYENRAHIANMSRVDYFYHLANVYLRTHMGDFEKVWVLAFPQCGITIPYEFRGVMCKVNWQFNIGALKLRGLNPKPGDVPEYDFEGDYFGYFNASAQYDLSNYDKQYVGDVQFQDLLGADGHSDNPVNNVASHTKGIIDTDTIRSEMNMYKALPDYDVTTVINQPTSIAMQYASPMHLRIEVPVGWDEVVFEQYPDYFWDYYEDNDTEKEINLRGVMQAMGVSIGGRDADIKSQMSLLKGYTAAYKYDSSIKIKRSESVFRDNYFFRDESTKKELYTNKVPLRTVLKAEGVSVTIPDGMLRVHWGSEIMPPPRNARWATEQEWKELFDKYNVHPRF